MGFFGSDETEKEIKEIKKTIVEVCPHKRVRRITDTERIEKNIYEGFKIICCTCGNLMYEAWDLDIADDTTIEDFGPVPMTKKQWELLADFSKNYEFIHKSAKVKNKKKSKTKKVKK